MQLKALRRSLNNGHRRPGLNLCLLLLLNGCTKEPPGQELPTATSTPSIKQSSPQSPVVERRKAAVIAHNSTFRSFAKAKRALEKIYQGNRRTFYCDCRFNRRKRISAAACNYRPLRNSKRAKRIEWEHIVPASAFGQSFRSWRDGHPNCVDRRKRIFRGRNCARKTSSLFRYMESDLHNLVPAVGELNGLRSNYGMAEIDDEERRFGNCDVEIANRKFEPPPSVRGNIARTYLYMHAAYPGHGVLSNKNRKLFMRWDRLDPVDAWECERERAVAEVQGNRNPFVHSACKRSGL